MSFVLVEEGTKVAGAMVYWSLRGLVDLQDLLDRCEAEGIDQKLWPEAPTAETIAFRALETCIQANLKGSRILVRPLSVRGTWDLVEEWLGQNNAGKEVLFYRSLVRVAVEKQDGGGRAIKIVAHDQEYRSFAKKIEEAIPQFRGLLTANDVSAWLLTLLQDFVAAVPMRDRGGIYFVPHDQVEKWHKVVRCVRAASDHQLFELPAIQSDEAVAAILEAVRKEAETAMTELEDYLRTRHETGVSTRGINAWNRDLSALKAKVEKYQALLGVSLPALTERVEFLTGALFAVKVKQKQANGELNA